MRACSVTILRGPIESYKEGRYSYLVGNWNQNVQKSDGPNTHVVRSSEEEVVLFVGGGCRNQERLRECWLWQIWSLVSVRRVSSCAWFLFLLFRHFMFRDLQLYCRNDAWSSSPIVSFIRADCCILRGPGGERIVNVAPGGTELETQVKTGSWTFAHTRSNPHVKCTEVYCAQTLNNAVTSEMYGVLLSWSGSLHYHTHWSPSFIQICWSPFEILLQTATGAQGSYSCTHDPTHCSRDKHLARPHINKKK